MVLCKMAAKHKLALFSEQVADDSPALKAPLL